MMDAPRPWQWIAVLCLCGILTTGLPVPTAHAQENDAGAKADAATKKLLAANGFLRNGQYKFARDEFRQFLQDYPQHAQLTLARYSLAVCEYRLSQFDKAIELCDQVLADAKFMQRDDALVILGHSQLSLGQNDKALAAFDTLLTKHPQSKHVEAASLYKAQVLYLLGRKDEALKASTAYVADYPKSPNLDAGMYIKALCQYDLTQYADSARTLKGLFVAAPNTRYQLDATYLLGQCQNELGQLDEAIASFKAMLAKAPVSRQAQGRYSLGVALYKAAQYDESIQQLKTVLADFAQDRYAAPARLQLGLTELAADNIDDARKTLQAVAKNDAERAGTAQYWLAQCDIRQKKYQNARQILDALFAADPAPANLDQVTFDRALCQMAMEKWPEAAAEFAAFRTKYAASPQIADATYRQAFCLHKTEKYEESLTLCQAVAKLPDSGDANASKRPAAELAAENQFLLSKFDDAALAFDALSTTAKNEDDKRRFTFRRGQCASFKDDFKSAIALLAPLAEDPAVAQDAKLNDAIFVLGDAYLQTQEYDKAVTTLKQYLGVSKSSRDEPRFKLGLAQLRSGDEASAATTLKSVSGGATESPWVLRALFEYGQLMYKEKKPQDAGASLAKVVESKAPEELSAPATYLLAWIDADAGKHKEAAARFASVTTQYPKHALAPDALFNQGVNQKQAGDTEAALATLQKYMTEQTAGQHINEARYQAGTCLAKLDKHADALKLFEPLATNEKTRTDALLYDMAWAYRATDAKTKAQSSYRQLLETYPQSTLVTASRAELAELIYENEQYTEAAGLLEQVLADKEASAATLAPAQYRLGWCYAKLKQPAKAAPVFAAFAATYPQDKLTASALYQAGDAFATLSKLDESEQALAKMLAQFPNDELNSVAALKLGQVQNEAGKFPQAATTFQAFLTKHPKDEFLYLAQFGLGWSLENQKMYAEARTWYAKVIENHNGPTAARSQFQIGEAFLKEMKYEEAAKELLKVEIVYAYPEWSARALYEAGQAYEQLKQPDEARTQYKLCVDKYKTEPPAELSQKRLALLK